MDKRTFNESEKKAYRKFADSHAPKSTLLKDCISAFLTGGAICCVGEGISDIAKSLGVNQENIKAVVPVSLIFLSCLFTGFGVYDKLASFAKAGTLVPITGFANSVCSSAIDAKSEGFIFGVGAKIFTLAGPVIVYGSVVSVLWGIIYFFMNYGLNL